MTEVKIGYGFRPIKSGEKFLPSDECAFANDVQPDGTVNWYGVRSSGLVVGQTLELYKEKWGNVIVGRRAIDVGEGYRLVQIDEPMFGNYEYINYNKSAFLPGEWMRASYATTAAYKTPRQNWTGIDYIGIAYRQKKQENIKTTKMKETKFHKTTIDIPNKEVGKAVLAYVASLGYSVKEQDWLPNLGGDWKVLVLHGNGDIGANALRGMPTGYTHFNAATHFGELVAHLSSPPTPVVTVRNDASQEYTAEFFKDYVKFGCASIDNNVLQAAFDLTVNFGALVGGKTTKEIKIGRGIFHNTTLEAIVTHPHFKKGVE